MQNGAQFTFQSVDLSTIIDHAQIQQDIAESLTAECKTFEVRLSSISSLTDKELSELERLIQETFGGSLA